MIGLYLGYACWLLVGAGILLIMLAFPGQSVEEANYIIVVLVTQKKAVVVGWYGGTYFEELRRTQRSK